MAIITKSGSDGYGIIAGFSWPSFGIVSGTLGLSTGGVGAILCGALAFGSFIVFGSAITYWSYEKFKNERRELLQRFERYGCVLMVAKDPLYATWKKDFVTAFFAAYGTIAGCTAGISGVLQGIGLWGGLATLAATPVVGWAILGGACLFGLLIANVYVHYSHQNNLLTQAILRHESILLAKLALSSTTSSSYILKAAQTPPSPTETLSSRSSSPSVARIPRSLSFDSAKQLLKCHCTLHAKSKHQAQSSSSSSTHGFAQRPT